METNIENKEKLKIYITIEPLGLKIGWVFKKNETIQSILNFVIIQTEKMGIQYKVGRINENKTGAMLLSESILGDFLQNDDQVTVYSEEYGYFSNYLCGNSADKNNFYHKNVSDLYGNSTFISKKRKKKKRSQNKQIKEENNEKTELKENEGNEEKTENSMDIYKNQTKERKQNSRNNSNLKKDRKINNNSNKKIFSNKNNTKDIINNKKKEKIDKSDKAYKKVEDKVIEKEEKKEKEENKENETKSNNKNSKETIVKRSLSDESSIE